ncbi:TPA: alpha-acetolactate decarboxylase, partial [Vibrio cholerae]
MANDICDGGLFCVIRCLLLDVRKKSVMANYHLEIQNVVNTALAELEAEHKAGKLAN